MRNLLILLISVLSGIVVYAQKKSEKNITSTVSTPSPDSVFASIKWRNIGPFRGGRSNAVSGVKNNDQIFYAGYTGGGVWKTYDAGITWKNISDGQFNVGSIGDIAVSESDPNVVYVGTGEHAVRGVMTSFGDGVYKSTDAGKSWKNIGLQKSRHISDIAIHPNDPDIVYVASQGTVHGNNAERGVFKSTDGGITWRKVLFINDSTGIASLALDMKNPRILYAASWEHRRLPWSVRSGGPGCSIWKSEDAGETWKKINQGLPSNMGKIGVAVSRANSNRVFAIVEAEKSKAGVYRSDDGGKTWNHLSSNQDLTARSWYYMKITADPVNENVLYVLNAPVMKSIDGGKTWANVRVGHGDTHDLWINPQYPSIMILGDDGGAEITYDSGNSWSSVMNQPTAQFYRVNSDNLFPYNLYGGQQDNTSVIIASRNNGRAITEKDWTYGPGCESAFLAFDPNDPTLVYGGCYQGYIEVMNRKNNESKDIQAYPSLNLAVAPKDMKYRFNWNAPIIASPHDPKTIYHAGNKLLRTRDGGITWDEISPDLTRNEPLKQGEGGGPLTNEGAGGENYNTIYYVMESTLEKDVIWTGSDCGLIHLTMDGGKTWNNVTPAGLQESLIQSIELSPHEKGVAYIAATRYKFNDYGAFAYRTSDYGKTWTPINTGIRSDDFIKVIREDKKIKGLLYAGSERGFYISFDSGNHWERMQLNLPVVPVTDLMIRNNDLLAATAGRAFWILDDISAIQQYAQGVKEVKLFTPKSGYRYGNGGSLQGNTNPLAGTNAPEGIIIDYYLPASYDSADIKLEILSQGKVIRKYSNKKNPDFKPYPGGPAPSPLLPSLKGVNRFLWDFRSEQLPDVPGVYVYGDYSGHRMPPGNYMARLTVNNTVSEAPITVLPDPNVKVNDADWKEQIEYLEKVEKDFAEIHAAVNTIRKAKKQLTSYKDYLKDQTGFKSISEEGDKLFEKLEKWEKNIIEDRITNGQDVINWPSKLNVEFINLKGLLDVQDPRVTGGIKKRFADLHATWEKEKAIFDNDLKNAVKDFNQKFKEAVVPAILMN